MEVRYNLPAFLRGVRPNNLVRLGKSFDGGYLVEYADVRSADVLISIGVSNDWSFERAFSKENDIDIFAFDKGLHYSFLLKNLLKNLLRFWEVRSILRRFQELIDYKFFFRGKRVHVSSFIGYGDGPDNIELGDFLDGISPEKKIFLKIDIEGCEYRLIDDILKWESQISGLVIEFHDVDLHLNKLNTFINSSTLQVCHINPNNFSRLDVKYKIPQCIEVTFTSRQESQAKQMDSPVHSLAQPNDSDGAALIFDGWINCEDS